MYCTVDSPPSAGNQKKKGCTHGLVVNSGGRNERILKKKRREKKRTTTLVKFRRVFFAVVLGCGRGDSPFCTHDIGDIYCSVASPPTPWVPRLGTSCQSEFGKLWS